MYEYHVIIGYYESPFDEKYQQEVIIFADNSKDIRNIIDETYHGMVVVCIDGYDVYN